MSAEKQLLQSGQKKVALLDAELYKNLKWANQTNKQLETPQMTKVRQLDEQIGEILADSTLSDYVKAKMYGEAVSEFFKLRGDTPEIKKTKEALQTQSITPTSQLKKGVETQTESKEEEEEEQEAEEAGPSREERAQQDRIDNIWELYLANQDQLRVGIQEDSGQVTLDGSPILDSNIDSILAYITRKRHPASMKPPPGTAYFLEAMGRVGLPPNLIPSTKLKGLLRQYEAAHKRQQQKGMGGKRKPLAKIKKWSKLFA